METLESNLIIKNKWNGKTAEKMNEAELLLYRSNLLGSDKRVTNYGGGNTSAKIYEKDPLSGSNTEVLWVKGSGGDIGSMKMDGFATLYMEKLQSLKSLYRGEKFEDEMVEYLPHCTYNLNSRAASIDTPLHAYVPKKHVDHVHADSIISIAASINSQELTQKIFGSSIGWLPWKRPGFELGLWLEQFCLENPDADGVILESHGLFTWANNAKSCYDLTIDTINKATVWISENSKSKKPFAGAKSQSLPLNERKQIAYKLMLSIRKNICDGQHMVGHFDDSVSVLEFVNSNQFDELASLGTSCPDHFLRTKIRPLVINYDFQSASDENSEAKMQSLIERYRKEYKEYYLRCKRDDSPNMRDPNPVIYLIPKVGMISFAKDKATARISTEFYINAINVMRGACQISTYFGLPEQEAFDIEYWQLEENKLRRLPAPKQMEGKTAFITGAAGGIGSATAQKLLNNGANVVLSDINIEALDQLYNEFIDKFGTDNVSKIKMDVTDENSVIDAFYMAVIEFGGIDILISNAGIASSAPIEETSLNLWNKNISILSTGYFLVSREAFKILKKQNIGGSIVFVASKNGIAASANASAYCSAKASEIHLARCLALEGAEQQIRVNVVNPDAVLRGSKIWEGEWLEQRANTYQTDKEGLEEMYRMRSMLKQSVFPEDIANAIYFLAGEAASKSTGNIINVDAGNVNSFTR